MTSTKQFVWTRGDRLEARNSNGTVTAQYFPMESSLGDNYFFTLDHLGSTQKMTNSSGAWNSNLPIPRSVSKPPFREAWQQTSNMLAITSMLKAVTVWLPAEFLTRTWAFSSTATDRRVGGLIFTPMSQTLQRNSPTRLELMVAAGTAILDLGATAHGQCQIRGEVTLALAGAGHLTIVFLFSFGYNPYYYECQEQHILQNAQAGFLREAAIGLAGLIPLGFIARFLGVGRNFTVIQTPGSVAVTRALGALKEWLGPGYTPFSGRGGSEGFFSINGCVRRQVRFDLRGPKPHLNIEEMHMDPATGIWIRFSTFTTGLDHEE